MEEITRLFSDAPSAYRGKPFWAWNGKLEPEELRRQIRVMHRMGLGGFFMHSRVGLATEYLGDEWFEMVEACVDEAEKLDMEAWLYDEDRWPSGAAGGLVTKDERYRHRNLVVVTCDPGELKTDEEPLALFAARVDGAAAYDVRRLAALPRKTAMQGGAKLLAFFVVPDEPSAWYNGATYLDTMSRKAVSRFINVTHEEYASRIGKTFGKRVPGIFTDEPNYGGVMDKAGIAGLRGRSVPWTAELPATFRKRYDYDILGHLPELFFNVEGEPVSQARYHYYDCITFLFTNAFARQIGEWCEENGLLYTGHVLCEETLRSQVSVVGAAMRFYEFMQAPGIDILTERSYEYGTAKQCSSVLRQMGRRWMLSELYGCTGWDFSFEAHKAVGDWQAALGVNLRCQHLCWYTMLGEAKRDYPASIHFQSPWWEHYAPVEDYFARVGVLMSRGESVRRLLVIHPVESVWTLVNCEWHDNKEIQRLDHEFEELRRWLLEEHVDFDYGDEEMLGRLASVESGPRVRVGKADYDAVLVAPLLTIRSSTLSLLKEFAQDGGTVIFCGDLPRFVDAAAGADDALAFAQQCVRVPYKRSAVADAAGRAGRVLSIKNAADREHPDVLYQLRREGDDLYLFMCNTNRKAQTGPLTVEVSAGGSVQLWDAETGRRSAVESAERKGKVCFSTSMPASGSRLFVITSRREELPATEELRETRVELLPAEGWSSQLTEPNVLVLDTPRYRMGDGEWQGPEEVLRVDAAIRDALGLEKRGGQMVQPWARKKQSGGPSAPIELCYRVDVESVPSGPLMLALEDPARFEIKINGLVVPVESECGWWVDPCLRLLPLDVCGLVVGANEITLRGTFDEGANLEAMFLLGRFAVALEGTSSRLQCGGEVTFGDWTQQGLPFYAGAVAHRRRVEVNAADEERVFLEIPDFRGACVRVLVDGAPAGVLAWPPYEADITELARDKREVELTVEVIAHRRNAFGPLHHVEQWPRWTGPGEYVTVGAQWQDEYNLVPCGCMSAPKLSYRTGA